MYSRIQSINRKYFNCILSYSFYIVSKFINDIPVFGNLWNLKYSSYPIAIAGRNTRETLFYTTIIWGGGKERTGTHNRKLTVAGILIHEN